MTMQIRLTLKVAMQKNHLSNNTMLVLNGFWIALFQNYVKQPFIIFIMSTVTEIEISFIDHY